MRARALAGPLVPRSDWAAPVAGIFRGALALAHPDGLWVTVLRSREDLEARALWFGEAAFDTLAARAILGASAQFYAGPPPGLSLGGFAIFFEPLEPWDSRADVAAAGRSLSAAGPGAFRAVADRIRDALERDGYAEGLHGEGPFAQKFAELRLSEDFPWNLVGFGPGTTPAGDDFLSGWLLGRRLRDCVPDAVAAVDLSRSTAPGRTLLAGALAGIFPAYLARTARALAALSPSWTVGDGGGPAADAEAEWAAACRSAFDHGASSGRDALLGLRDSLDRSFE